VWNRWRLVTVAGALVAALGACLGWIPFVHKPLSPDEGGFLLVASQWSPGSSLYGNYWVDRPPLLIGIFRLAHSLGGPVPLRLVGALAAASSALLAARLAAAALPARDGQDGQDGQDAAGSHHADRSLRILGVAAVATAFTSTPLFGATEVDGEILAVPLVLAGILFLLRAWTSHGLRALMIRGCAAGVCGGAAAMVKQNVVDVAVVSAVLVVSSARVQSPRRAVVLGGSVTLGGVVAIGATVAAAASRGTPPGQLWMALGPFRAQATAVLATYARGRADRLHSLMLSSLLSGAVVLVLVLALHLATSRPPSNESPHRAPGLALPAAALIAWELVAVALGGSFWSHYLMGLVPGLVLLTVAAAQRRARTWWPALGVIAACLCSSLIALAGTRVATATTDLSIARFIHDHARPTDSLVVCFGHADIIWSAGLPSPYRWLWALPVQVKDPHLRQLTSVLRGPSRPTWLVVRGQLANWGVSPGGSQHVIHRDFHVVDRVGTSTIYHANG
jgi:hypothetical protein